MVIHGENHDEAFSFTWRYKSRCKRSGARCSDTASTLHREALQVPEELTADGEASEKHGAHSKYIVGCIKGIQNTSCAIPYGYAWSQRLQGTGMLASRGCY